MTKFTDIFGQEQAIATLLNAYRADRLPHGMIFAGPAGVGKMTTARRWRLYFCATIPNPRHSPTKPAGKCESCTLMGVLDQRRFDESSRFSRGLPATDPAGQRQEQGAGSVDRRDPGFCRRAGGRKPMMNRGKVFVLEEADLMNPQARECAAENAGGAAGAGAGDFIDRSAAFAAGDDSEPVPDDSVRGAGCETGGAGTGEAEDR